MCNEFNNKIDFKKIMITKLCNRWESGNDRDSLIKSAENFCVKIINKKKSFFSWEELKNFRVELSF